MIILKGNKTIEIDRNTLSSYIDKYTNVVIDLGTGDGKYVLKNAQKDKDTLYIGIDPSEKQLKVSSRDIQRKKINNAILAVGSIESLPSELKNTADKMVINLPWGTLLESISKPIDENINKIIELMKVGAALEIIFGYSSFLEKNETRRLGLNDMSLEYINNILIPRYKSLGLNINRCEEFNNNENSINTTWMKKLLYLRNKHNIRERNIYYLSFSKNN